MRFYDSEFMGKLIRCWQEVMKNEITKGYRLEEAGSDTYKIYVCAHLPYANMGGNSIDDYRDKEFFKFSTKDVADKRRGSFICRKLSSAEAVNKTTGYDTYGIYEVVIPKMELVESKNGYLFFTEGYKLQPENILAVRVIDPRPKFIDNGYITISNPGIEINHTSTISLSPQKK